LFYVLLSTTTIPFYLTKLNNPQHKTLNINHLNKNKINLLLNPKSELLNKMTLELIKFSIPGGHDHPPQHGRINISEQNILQHETMIHPKLFTLAINTRQYAF
ncbi:MAG: hypothetical protein KDC07_11535, partial [Chitinophagaceae bacterium]|nr:hypothetical protein [Chitinophagaceae bacterium]